MSETKEAVDARIRATGIQKKSPGTPKVLDKKRYAALQRQRGQRPKAQRSFQFNYKPVSGPPKTELGAKSTKPVEPAEPPDYEA